MSDQCNDPDCPSRECAAPPQPAPITAEELEGMERHNKEIMPLIDKACASRAHLGTDPMGALLGHILSYQPELVIHRLIAAVRAAQAEVERRAADCAALREILDSVSPWTDDHVLGDRCVFCGAFAEQETHNDGCWLTLRNNPHPTSTLPADRERDQLRGKLAEVEQRIRELDDTAKIKAELQARGIDAESFTHDVALRINLDLTVQNDRLREDLDAARERERGLRAELTEMRADMTDINEYWNGGSAWDAADHATAVAGKALERSAALAPAASAGCDAPGTGDGASGEGE
jgi:hypothetical protein